MLAAAIKAFLKDLSGKLKCQTMGDFSDEGGKINLPISKLVDRRIKDLKQSQPDVIYVALFRA
jgi:hypothetical protein